MSAKESFSAGQTRQFFGDGDFFRLLQTTGPITVEFYFQGREVAEMVDIEAGYAESFAREQKRFDRIRIYSPTAQDVKWVIRDGSDVRYDRGAASITGTVDLGAGTLEELSKPIEASGDWVSTAQVVANTPQTVFTPGANVNGAIVISAFASDNPGGGGYFSLLAKASAPAGIGDGELICVSSQGAFNSPNYAHHMRLEKPQLIAPGKGLYFIGSVGGIVGAVRGVRYKLL